MKEINKTYAIILLIVLVAIGGLVLYGKDETLKTNQTPRMPSDGPVNIPKNL